MQPVGKAEAAFEIERGAHHAHIAEAALVAPAFEQGLGQPQQPVDGGGGQGPPVVQVQDQAALAHRQRHKPHAQTLAIGDFGLDIGVAGHLIGAAGIGLGDLAHHAGADVITPAGLFDRATDIA